MTNKQEALISSNVYTQSLSFKVYFFLFVVVQIEYY